MRKVIWDRQDPSLDAWRKHPVGEIVNVAPRKNRLPRSSPKLRRRWEPQQYRNVRVEGEEAGMAPILKSESCHFSMDEEWD